MSDFIMVLIAVATFAFVGYPFFRRRPAPAPSVGDVQLQELYAKRNTTYSMLKELEFDHSSGILSDEDYKDLESKYKGKAVSILKGIDESAAAATDMEAEIEKQIGALRRGKKRAVHADDEIEKAVQALRRGKKETPDADAEIEKAVRGLRHGKKEAPDTHAETEAEVQQLPSRGLFCTECGAKSLSGDRFCSHCGAKLR
ncbi:MAG: zinc-ribbon domain-containing protein [Chloroflexi bacterium]|nr:zinc-ribbon domain-containing protein [Chloroflexota bacterium]